MQRRRTVSTWNTSRYPIILSKEFSLSQEIVSYSVQMESLKMATQKRRCSVSSKRKRRSRKSARKISQQNNSSTISSQKLKNSVGTLSGGRPYRSRMGGRRINSPELFLTRQKMSGCDFASIAPSSFSRWSGGKEWVG